MQERTITMFNVFMIGFVASLGVKAGNAVWDKYLTAFFKTKIKDNK